MTAFWRLAAALTALTVLRIVALRYSVVDLFHDEAQYWAWAQTPAFGYFSKPPLLAWIIAGAQDVCGTSEACIRAPAPLFYLGTALVSYQIALSLYDARVALWASVCLFLAPGLIFSTRVISTDVPLLFFFALALLGFIKLRDTPHWGWTIVLGVALGLGLLAKYAMAYFILGVALAAILDARTRILLRRPHPWVALAIGIIVLVPNLVWVAAYDFVTFRHTEHNISGGGLRFDPRGALEFVGSQFGVFGPIVFGAFLVLLVRARTAAQSSSDRVAIAMALPPLVLVTLVGLFFKVNANWAAPSAIPLTIVAVAVLVRQARGGLLYATVTIGVAVQAALWIGDARADRISFAAFRNPDIYHRTLGWRDLGEKVAAMAKANGARSVAADQRDVVASLIYYLRGDGLPVTAWPVARAPTHQFDIDRPLTPHTPQPVLAINDCAYPARFATHYAHVTPLGPIVTPTGQHSERRFYGYLLSDSIENPPLLGPCAP